MVVSLFKHIHLLITLTVGYFRWCEWNGHFIMSDCNFSFLSPWVWDTILGHIREHFSFINYLVSATLLQGDRFEQYWATVCLTLNPGPPQNICYQPPLHPMILYIQKLWVQLVTNVNVLVSFNRAHRLHKSLVMPNFKAHVVCRIRWIGLPNEEKSLVYLILRAQKDGPIRTALCPPQCLICK